jgi:hypothetical protein
MLALMDLASVCVAAVAALFAVLALAAKHEKAPLIGGAIVAAVLR